MLGLSDSSQVTDTGTKVLVVPMDETPDPFWATTDDLTEEGVFLRTTTILAADDTCLLKVFKGAKGDLWAQARVVHHIPGVGFGCRFVQMDPRMRERLTSWVLTERDPTLAGVSEEEPWAPLTDSTPWSSN